MIAVFCVALSLLLAHCHSVQVNVQISLEHRNHAVRHDEFMVVPSLSRKLKLNGEATAKTFAADRDLMPQKLLEDSSGEIIVNENQENAERTVEDFAMDYHGVRRRRPIHNRQINP